jgi:L1 cell adhesion molecule
VTIWELLTYGARPYENIPAKDVPDLIEVGHKLPQPDICSLDIYCILLSCWVLDADARPTFKQLAEALAEKARDPGRYLMIPGDTFMRLPSYTTQDEKDLIRSLASTMEVQSGNNNVETEDYMHPKSRISDNNLENIISNELSKRYCSDPLKNGDDQTDSSTREVGVGNIRLELPLDEDDYLMPTSSNQATATTSGYMDLVGLPPTIQPTVDNPEYLLDSTPKNINENQLLRTNLNNNDGSNVENSIQKQEGDKSSLPTQTLGIPLAISNEHEPTTIEHEYYNDLQRELQPLQRNETTV